MGYEIQFEIIINVSGFSLCQGQKTGVENLF